jgi:hypothetical protein
MPQFTTLYEVGDRLRPRYGNRRGSSFRVDEIRIHLAKGARLVTVSYRPVFASDVKGGWIDEENLELVERGLMRGTVRDFRNGENNK